MKPVRILLFYGIAIGLSYLFRINPPAWYTDLELGGGLTVFKYLAEGLGPAIGALIIIFIFRPKREITFFGTSRLKSIGMILLPLVLFTGIGIENTLELNAHYYGFLVGLFSIGYVILEELGWRGYLLDELKAEKLNPITRSVIIGVLWYIWHLNFSISSSNISEHLSFLGILIFASWGFEKITDTTKSVLSVACFHLLGSIMSYNLLLKGGFTDNQRWIIFGICLVVWIYVVSTWDKQRTSANQ
ncbi:MAG: hypothetical protein DHS20C18_07020 [Saprospiraceae bacterium]|nr:MAG: hypothetical protein DHS20C18_07020 [Saprospiraceae bacterium]